MPVNYFIAAVLLAFFPVIGCANAPTDSADRESTSSSEFDNISDALTHLDEKYSESWKAAIKSYDNRERVSTSGQWLDDLLELEKSYYNHNDAEKLYYEIFKGFLGAHRERDGAKYFLELAGKTTDPAGKIGFLQNALTLNEAIGNEAGRIEVIGAIEKLCFDKDDMQARMKKLNLLCSAYFSVQDFERAMSLQMQLEKLPLDEKARQGILWRKAMLLSNLGKYEAAMKALDEYEKGIEDERILRQMPRFRFWVSLEAGDNESISRLLEKMPERERKLSVRTLACKKMEGKSAPDFELATLEGKKIRLQDYRGKIVLLFLTLPG